MKNEKIAYKKGYRIKDNGDIKGIRKNKLKPYVTSNGYFHFSASINGKSITIPVHRLQAYQKFGDMMFGKDTEVRHLDGNKKNNRWDNIQVGTSSNNKMDIPKKRKTKKSK